MTTLPPGTIYAVGGLVVAVASFIAGTYYASSQEESKDLELIEDLEGAEGFEMTSPRSAGSSSGAIGAVMRARKKRKALSDGVVRWHVIGSAFEAPKYIKPERKEGGNIPEIKYQGETYCFPEEAAVPSEEEGVPVVVHRRGEADPINLRDGWDDAVDAGVLAEYLTLRVTSTKPKGGLLDGLGFGGYTSMEIFRYGLLGIIGLAIVWSLLQNGV